MIRSNIGESPHPCQYHHWRPSQISSKKIVDGDLDMENLDLSLIANVVQQDKKEKRKQKRGPNKWMPMRRTVDPEVQNRIRQAAGLNDEEKTPEGSEKKEKAKKPASR